MNFQQWLSMRESSPATRTRSAVARGLMPLAALGSLHGKSTANPWEAEQIKKAISKQHKKRKKKSFGASPSKKKISITNHNLEVDRWMKEVGDLKGDLLKLKAVFDSKKKNLKDIEKKSKPVVKSSTDKEEKQNKPEKVEKPEKLAKDNPEDKKPEEKKVEKKLKDKKKDSED